MKRSLDIKNYYPAPKRLHFVNHNKLLDIITNSSISVFKSTQVRVTTTEVSKTSADSEKNKQRDNLSEEYNNKHFQNEEDIVKSTDIND